ncbi:hypothetical protein TrLO_g3196 [Triparma laevis f. longispina]|uniref:Uncharacterized protein n=1 Tax=Triparma laevis f. longispina TaxID=1714387 RepID=A0A9W7FBD5_9STRA|nr:hypothetical protein TrLO_g3196 [Triparma laevis f. longispina]
MSISSASLQELREEAFAYCDELKSMTIPYSLQTFSTDDFLECFKLVSSNIDVGDIDENGEEIPDPTFEVVAYLRSQQE